MPGFDDTNATGGRKDDKQIASRRKQKVVGRRDFDRAPARQVKREWLEGRHVPHLLNVLHLHGVVLPLRWQRNPGNKLTPC